jgi:outer membrane lipoprotein carrier protein
MASVKSWPRHQWVEGMRVVSLSRILMGILCSVSLQTAFAEATDDLQQRFDALTALRSSFVQETFDERGLPLEKLEGQFVWQRPGKLRWEVQQPYAQLIVSDGAQLWLYEPDLQQASLRSLNEVMKEGGFLAVLAGTEPLREGYQVALVQQSAENSTYRLQPLQETVSMRDLLVQFDADGLRLLEFVDGIGQQHRLQFSGRHAEAFPQDFEFTPPIGTEVIRSPGVGVDG